VVKSIVGVALLVVLIIVTTDPNMLPTEHVKCLKDTLFGMTEPVNNYFVEHTTAKKVITGILAGLMDVLLLTSLGLWCVFGKSWRYPIAVTLAYLLRLFFSVRLSNLLSARRCTRWPFLTTTFGSTLASTL